MFDKLHLGTKVIPCNFIPDDEIWVSKSVYESIKERIDSEDFVHD